MRTGEEMRAARVRRKEQDEAQRLSAESRLGLVVDRSYTLVVEVQGRARFNRKPTPPTRRTEHHMRYSGRLAFGELEFYAPRRNRYNNCAPYEVMRFVDSAAIIDAKEEAPS